jgi:hypothetical protein
MPTGLLLVFPLFHVPAFSLLPANTAKTRGRQGRAVVSHEVISLLSVALATFPPEFLRSRSHIVTQEYFSTSLVATVSACTRREWPTIQANYIKTAASSAASAGCQ